MRKLLILLILTSNLYSSVLISQNEDLIKNPNDILLLYTTVKISITYKNPDNDSLIKGGGTAFFFDFSDNDSIQRPYLVTNKHVIENAIAGELIFTKRNKDGFPDSSFVYRKIDRFQQRWIYHPDSKVDLCIMPIATIINEIGKTGTEIFYTLLHQGLIPTIKEWAEFNVIEPIKIVGYPIGLSDTVNNYPLFRIGISSTPLFINFNGKSEFVVDAACFPGSSGSPILILDERYRRDSNGNIIYEKRSHLIGILYGGPVITKNHEIIFKKISTNVKAYSIDEDLLNLGYAIKSTKLLDFKKLINN